MIYNALVHEIARYLYQRDFPGYHDFDQLVSGLGIGKDLYYKEAREILAIIGIVEDGKVAQGE